MTKPRGLRSLVTDAAVYGAARTLVKFVHVFMIPIYTRYLAISEYGIIENLNALAQMLLPLFGAALPAAVVQRYAGADRDDERAAVVSSAAAATLALGGGMLLAGVASAGALGALLVRGTSSENHAILLLAFVGNSMTLQSVVYLAILRARFDKRRYLVASLVAALGTVGLNLVFVIGLELGVKGTLLAGALAQAAATLYCHRALREWIRLNALSMPLVRGLLAFGVPFMLSGFLIAIVRSSDRYLISLLVDDPLPKIALYGMAEKCMFPLVLASSAFGMAWAPFALAVSRQADARDVHVRTFRFYVSVTALLLVASAMLAPVVLRILTTPAYYPSARFTPAVGLYLALNYLAYIGSLGFLLTGRSRAMAPIVAVAAAVNVALNVLLIPRFAVMGAIWATVAAFVAYNLLMFAVGERHERVGFPVWRGFAVYALAYVAGEVALLGIVHGVVAFAAFALVLQALGFLDLQRLPGLVRSLSRRAA
ncbi:MAG: lipopolysaccharide biosynthesis protein [Candidatus Rokubacteria bacterium]|nr:lipopolysaccharide biosynthesis protein [Candidatus Rokubacteria bacterium]